VVFLVLSKPGAAHEERFHKQKGYTMLFGMDVDGMQLFSFSAIPSTAFIDKTGKVVDKYVGGMDEAQLKASITKIL